MFDEFETKGIALSDVVIKDGKQKYLKLSLSIREGRREVKLWYVTVQGNRKVIVTG